MSTVSPKHKVLNAIFDNKVGQNALAVTRAAAIAALALPVLALTALQGVVGPLTNNQTIIPKMVYHTMRALMGYKIVFNDVAAKEKQPLHKRVFKTVRDLFVKQPVRKWNVANHMSVDDFIILGSTLNNSTFAGKGDIMKWPVIAHMARAVNYIGLRRSKEFNPLSRGKIISNLNDNHDTSMFPEGTTTPGKTVSLFRAGLITLLFGENGVLKPGKIRAKMQDLARKLRMPKVAEWLEVSPKKLVVELKRQVVIQPVAVTVLEVNGHNAAGNDDLRNLYSMHDIKNDFRRAWERMKIREIKIGVTLLEPLNPQNYIKGRDMSLVENREAAGKEIINDAALAIASIVNPGQTTFEKATIPGVEDKKKLPAPAA